MKPATQLFTRLIKSILTIPMISSLPLVAVMGIPYVAYAENAHVLQLQDVYKALELSYNDRIIKLIELSQQGNMMADMTLYRYQKRGDAINYHIKEKNVTQAIKTLQTLQEDAQGMVAFFRGINYMNGNLGISQDYTQAMQWYQKAADQGNAGAMYNIGYLYQYGQGVTQDYTQAMQWYQKAADQGDAGAMIGIGYLYYNGQGVTQDYTKAMQWYQKAADQGDADAMYNIGYLYEKGQGVTQDYTKAMQWYQKAADQGDAGAMKNIGVLYHNGQGVTQDYTQAMQWYQKAANQGNAGAMFNIGYLYQYGQGVTQDYTQAMQWYQKAADQGNAGAMHNIGYLYEKGQGVTQDYTQAIQWYQKAADQGNAGAMYNIGYLYQYGQGVTQDYTQAMQWYQKAADQGNAGAMFNIGYLYQYGQGVTQDYTKAMQWYQKAVDQGYADAMYNIGYLYKYGQGVTQDYTQAMQWYQKAVDKGDAVAMNGIGLLYQYGQGVTQDYTKAMQWYQKAADKGEAVAMNNIGYLYEKGHGVTQDYTKAMQWYQKAADKGYAVAMANIGVLYQYGQGVTQDYTKAMRWWKKAADKGEAGAMYGIGLLYKNGQGVTQDSNEAMRWFLKAYQGYSQENNSINADNFSNTKNSIDSLINSGKVTDAKLIEQAKKLFTPAPLVAWTTTPPSTTSQEAIKLSVTLTDQGGGIGDVRILLNGVVVDQQGQSRGIASKKVKQTQQDFNLILPEGKHTITVEAYPAENLGITNKVSQTITSTYKKITKPKLHAVVIGINEFENTQLNLTYASSDAQAIYQSLNKQIGGVYDKGSMILLNTKANTNKDNIVKQLQNIQQQAKMGDVFVFYVASHGYNSPNAGYFLLTSSVGATSTEKLKQNAIDANSLQDLLAKVQTNKKLIILDTCNSGGALDAKGLIATRGMDDQMVVDRMNHKTGAVVLSASTSQQDALEGYQGHGLFTYGLLKAFSGVADGNKDGYASTSEIANYLENEIPVIAKQHFSRSQQPHANIDGQNFEFKVVR